MFDHRGLLADREVGLRRIGSVTASRGLLAHPLHSSDVGIRRYQFVPIVIKMAEALSRVWTLRVLGWLTRSIRFGSWRPAVYRHGPCENCHHILRHPAILRSPSVRGGRSSMVSTLHALCPRPTYPGSEGCSRRRLPQFCLFLQHMQVKRTWITFSASAARCLTYSSGIARRKTVSAQLCSVRASLQL